MSIGMRVGPSPFDTLDTTATSLKPFWTLPDFDDEDKVLEWIKNAIVLCEDYYRGLFNTQFDNLLVYKGIHWLSQERTADRLVNRAGTSNRRTPKVVINHLYDYTEQWVSKVTRYRPAVKVFPANTEYQDTEDAKVSQLVLDNIWYEQKIDSVLQKFIRQTKVFGESYLWITWNPHKGPLHPDYQRAQAMGQRIPVMKSPVEGQEPSQVLNDKGDPLFIESSVHVGDVEYGTDAPWHTYDMPCSNRDDIDWSFRWRSRPVDTVKAEYPDQADKIKSDSTGGDYDRYMLELGRVGDQVIEYEFFHRSMRQLEKGRYIRCTRNAILENRDLPYSHGKIPYVRIADIDVPDEIRGMSFYQQLYPLQHQVNACASLIYKGLVLFAHPKFMMPAGSCDIQQLLNDSTIVSFKGPVAPQILNSPPVPHDAFAWKDSLVGEMDKLSGIFSMSRGEAPSGVRAARALRLMEEQEQKRDYNFIVKYNENAIVENAKMTIAVAGDYYDDADGRLARVVGKDNEYLVTKFTTASLNKAWDIRVEETTALSRSPAARLEEMTELANLRFAPDSLFTRQEFIDMTDLGNSDKMRDLATRAVRCAEAESQDILAGREIADPTVDEELISHWKVHIREPQSRTFKVVTPTDIKKRFIDHVRATELLMHNKAFGTFDENGIPMTPPNMAYQQKLMMECPDWPMYFTVPAPPPPPMPMGPGGPMSPPDSTQASSVMAPDELPPEGDVMQAAPLPEGGALP